MTEFIVFRNSTRYDVVQDGIDTLYAIRTGGFFCEKLTFYNNDSAIVCVYEKKRRLVSKNIRQLFIPATNNTIEIKYKLPSYLLNLDEGIYELRYGLFNFSGFFHDRNLIGTVETINTGAIEYTKRISFNEKTENILLLLFTYIAVDYFDVN